MTEHLFNVFNPSIYRQGQWPRCVYRCLFGCLLLLQATTLSAEPVTLKVEDAYANMHTFAGKHYPVFYVAERGDTLTLLKRRTDWFKVSLIRERLKNHPEAEKIGWIHLSEILNMRVASASGQLARDDKRINTLINTRWYGGFQIGQLTNADQLAVLAGFQVDDYLAFELHASEYIGRSTEGYVGNAQVRYSPYPKWMLSPFFTVGGGEIKTNFKSTVVQIEDTSDNFLQTGAGFDVHLNKKYRLRLEYKHLNILTSRTNNEEIESWLIGFITNF